MNIQAESSKAAITVLENIRSAVDTDSKWRKRLSHEENAVRRFIFKEFPNLGRAPTKFEIAEALSMDGKEVDRILKSLDDSDIIYMKDSEILAAYPFYSKPTNHKVLLHGGKRSLYAVCAIDALGIPFMYKRGVDIESKCAHCHDVIHIKIVDDRIVKHYPEEVLVWIGLKYSSHAATSLCTSLVFFHSVEHLDDWQSKNPDEVGTPLSLAEGMFVGKTLFENML
jgi:hypothetical protein